jgi:hypothetical protein
MRIIKTTLSDGSPAFSVILETDGGRDIEAICIDEDAAENLNKVWEHGVISCRLLERRNA